MVHVEGIPDIMLNVGFQAFFLNRNDTLRFKLKNHGISKLMVWRSKRTLLKTESFTPLFLEGPTAVS